MTTRIMSIIMLAAACCVALAQQAASPSREQSRPALLALGGADSKITQSEFVRITNSDAWNALWRRHKGISPDLIDHYAAIPVIDFTRCTVVAFFRSETTNRAGEDLQGVDEVDGTLRLRFDSRTYQTSSPLNSDDKTGGAQKATSFGIWVLPRTDKSIVIEENVQGLKNEGPKWKEQFRFPAIQAGR